MTKENNLEKSSQDYKKSQYGSWYKKNAENKKEDKKEEKTSLFKKIKNFFINLSIRSKLYLIFNFKKFFYFLKKR